MTSLNTVKAWSSIATVAVAIEADAKRPRKAFPMLYAGNRLTTSVWSVALISSCVRIGHRCLGTAGQLPARNVCSGRMTRPESYCEPWRFSSESWCAHQSSAGHAPAQQRQSAAARAQLLKLGAPRTLKHLLMRNALLAQHRTGPNPALKRNANSAPRRPSSAGPCGPFCARCPARHAAGVRLALR
jgi:hypothetical protein